jgi:CubicO group peptidase (beta-lactamase class C family)
LTTIGGCRDFPDRHPLAFAIGIGIGIACPIFEDSPITPSRRTMLQGAIGGAWTLAAAADAQTTAPAPFPIEAWMELASVPGASWAMLDGARLTTGAAGNAKAGETRVTTDTLFEAASLSKPVLAVAIHDLVRDRLIDLDEPVARHVDFTTDPETRMLTPRHLLSHSSGLPNWRTDAGSELVSRFKPGSAFRYSGEGFALLGRLAEAVTGRTAAEMVRSRVLIPAGMTRSTYGWLATDRPAVAWPHDAGGDVMPAKGPEGAVSLTRTALHQMHLRL